MGILNLKGANVRSIVDSDKSALSELFWSVTEGVSSPPSCDVLFIYCDFDGAGQIVGMEANLRDVICEACAKIVILASDNPTDKVTSILKPTTGYGSANVVITINRKGHRFASFYHRLFTEMWKGVPMPDAWVTLAPQVSTAEHSDCPESIFACEIGPLSFGPGSIFGNR